MKVVGIREGVQSLFSMILCSSYATAINNNCNNYFDFAVARHGMFHFAGGVYTIRYWSMDRK